MKQKRIIKDKFLYKYIDELSEFNSAQFLIHEKMFLIPSFYKHSFPWTSVWIKEPLGVPQQSSG